MYDIGPTSHALSFTRQLSSFNKNVLYLFIVRINIINNTTLFMGIYRFSLLKHFVSFVTIIIYLRINYT